MMAAGDTFRAAAVEQFGTWAERSGAELVRGNEGGDPSAVIFDAIESATARHIDLVLGDTAGRLHTKTNLMEELRKVRRVAAKGAGQVTEVLLVVDATTGQNGLAQAREFGDATEVTGVVLTKLDGSAKGGIVFAIETELGLPVKLVGLGESIGDLVAVRSRPSSSMPWSEKIHDSGNQQRFIRTSKTHDSLTPSCTCRFRSRPGALCLRRSQHHHTSRRTAAGDRTGQRPDRLRAAATLEAAARCARRCQR